MPLVELANSLQVNAFKRQPGKSLPRLSTYSAPDDPIPELAVRAGSPARRDWKRQYSVRQRCLHLSASIDFRSKQVCHFGQYVEGDPAIRCGTVAQHRCCLARSETRSVGDRGKCDLPLPST